MANKRKAPKREMTVGEAEEALLESRKAAARAAALTELTVPVPTAALLLGISKAQVYDTIREGTFPVPTIRVGRAFRVPTRALRELLQIQEISAPR